VKKRRAELHAKAAERADDFFIPTAAASSNNVPDHDRRLTPPAPEAPASPDNPAVSENLAFPGEAALVDDEPIPRRRKAEPEAENAGAPRQGMAALLERLESGSR
jgi:hypothetical protein